MWKGSIVEMKQPRVPGKHCDLYFSAFPGKVLSVGTLTTAHRVMHHTYRATLESTMKAQFLWIHTRVKGAPWWGLGLLLSLFFWIGGTNLKTGKSNYARNSKPAPPHMSAFHQRLPSHCCFRGQNAWVIFVWKNMSAFIEPPLCVSMSSSLLLSVLLRVKVVHVFVYFAGLLVYVAMMVGALVWGGLCDKMGRRKCLIYVLTIDLIFSFLSCFAQGYGFFLFFRFCSGFGWD